MTTTRKLDIPLAELTADKQFSSQEVTILMCSSMEVMDVWLTFILRYVRVAEIDVPKLSDDTISGSGSTIDWAAAHPEAALPLFLFFLTTAAGRVYYDYQKKKTEQAKNLTTTSQKFICAKLSEQKAPAEPAAVEAVVDPNNVIAKLNTYLENAIREDEQLRTKYKNIKLSLDKITIEYLEEEKKVVAEEKHQASLRQRAADYIMNSRVGKYVLKPVAEFSNKYVVKPLVKTAGILWDSLPVMAFAYWIVTISTSIFTGIFDSASHLNTGFPLLDISVGLALPIAAGLVYPFMKLAHWIKTPAPSKYAETEEKVDDKVKKETLDDVNSLFAKYYLKNKIDGLSKALEDSDVQCGLTLTPQDQAALQFKHEANSQELVKDKKTKLGRAFLTNTVGRYIDFQYMSVIVTDVIEKVSGIVAPAIPIVNFIFGIALFVGAGISGLFSSYNKNKEIEQTKASLANSDVNALDVKITEQSILVERNKNAVLKQSLAKNVEYLPEADREKWQVKEIPQFSQPQFYKNTDRVGPDKWTNAKRYAADAWSFINGFMSGAFIVRVLAVKGTAVFLPFVAVALGNPWTIALGVGVGLAWGAYKLYENRKKRNEANATLEYGPEKKMACTAEYKLLRQQNASLEKRVEKLKSLQAAAPTPVIPAPQEGSAPVVPVAQEGLAPATPDRQPPQQAAQDNFSAPGSPGLFPRPSLVSSQQRPSTPAPSEKSFACS